MPQLCAVWKRRPPRQACLFCHPSKHKTACPHNQHGITSAFQTFKGSGAITISILGLSKASALTLGGWCQAGLRSVENGDLQIAETVEAQLHAEEVGRCKAQPGALEKTPLGTLFKLFGLICPNPIVNKCSQREWMPEACMIESKDRTLD